MEKEIYQETLRKFVSNICPLEEAGKLDYLERFLKLASNYPLLAADTLLRKELVGKLEEIISLIICSLDYSENNCRALIEVTFNLFGLESKRVGFSNEEKEKAVELIAKILKEWEKSEEGRMFLEKTISNILQEMKKVLLGKSLAAKMAENIESKLDKENLVESFLMAAKSEIEENVYYKMSNQGFCKFGNDSATGLRIVRHFDFVQVSSNPVIAARAYEEFPELWEDFRKVVKVNPQWRKNPEKYADEITLFATINSILPNVLVFRPLALLSDFRDGLVSYQLNPFFAENSKKSIDDAKKIYSVLKDILYFYDQWLGWDVEKWQGRPNIVFKVAACAPAAIEITKKLNTLGIGTNNTVTYSVSQEVTLLFAEAEGMAKALKKGILPSQVYQTNMIGRTEDHLREAEIERLLEKLTEEEFWQLSREIVGEQEIKGNRQEISKVISNKKYLKSLTDDRLVKFFQKYLGENTKDLLSQLEDDIQHSGIFVTRRVYRIFFEHKSKILEWLQKQFKLSLEQAQMLFDRIDLLPASKRRARDTYLVLGRPNVTNTDFPDQQLRVYLESKKDDFNLKGYWQSIKENINPAISERLSRIEDFQKIYELTPELSKRLKAIGIEGDFGNRGMKPKDWKNYGAVQKTMQEFKKAYQDFQEKVLEFLKS